MNRTGVFQLAVVVALSVACSEPGDIQPDAGTPDASPGELRPEVYASDRSLSPVTPYIAAHLRAIAERDPSRRDNVFAKVGGTASVSQNFMHCLDDGYQDPSPGEQAGAIGLAGRDDLKATIAHFRDGDADGDNPYRRLSIAASVGATAADILDGAPNRLDREYAAIEPRFALILLGVTDLPEGDADSFGSALLDIADRSIDAGVIPILATAMPRTDDAGATAEVSHYNAIVRAVAQARQVPLIDLYRELVDVPGQGLGEDGVSPSVYRPDTERLPCVFDASGLEHGYNARNLLSLQTLDRLRRVLVADEPAPDVAERGMLGSGTAADPFIVEQLPFVHAADTALDGVRVIDTYDGCQAGQNEAGPEVTYRLDVAQPTRIRATVVDRGDTDIDVHVLEGTVSSEACIARAHKVVAVDLQPGTYYLNLDTFVGNDIERSGEYLLTITEEL